MRLLIKPWHPTRAQLLTIARSWLSAVPAASASSAASGGGTRSSSTAASTSSPA